ERESGDTTAIFGISGEFSHRRDNKKEMEILNEEKKRITLLLNNVKREALLKLEGLISQFERLKKQTAGLKAEILPGAEKLYNLSIEGYKLGKIGQAEVLQVQRELLDMRKAYWDKTAELWAAATAIETLTGHGFTYVYECGTEEK
ncbi:MAG: TolC family protein, partial [Candidatus Riflebacteria bacterium]|nr:TolC family protein [Candidatus Riflebacteria bacterium]